MTNGRDTGKDDMKFPKVRNKQEKLILLAGDPIFLKRAGSAQRSSFQAAENSPAGEFTYARETIFATIFEKMFT